jgi:hypothetical protein
MVLNFRGSYGYGVGADGGVKAGVSELKGEAGVIVGGCQVFAY